MKISPKSSFRAAACFLTLATSAPAVIVDGVNGTGTNNAGQGTLDSFLASESMTVFPYWENLVRVHDASGTYLGYNASTGQGWVLSANHIDPEPTSIPIAGTSYPVHGTGTQIGTTDLILYAIGGDVGDPALPTLSAVPLLSAGVAVNDFLLMTGRGRRILADEAKTTAPYAGWNPGTSDALPMRWGTNVLNGTSIASGLGTLFSTEFEAPPVAPIPTDFEAHLSLGDSGGGGFVLEGGEWQLAGVNSTVTVPLTANYTDQSYLVDVPSYRDSILAVTGTLVPEPSSVLLMLVGGVGLMGRRSRRVS